MHPNPTTVYANEFDPVEQAGGGPREFEFDDHGGQTLVVDDVINDRVEDLVASDLASDAKMEDDAYNAECVGRIYQLETECQRAELMWVGTKMSADEAKRNLDAAMDRLRKYIQAIKIQMPLFDRIPDGSPGAKRTEVAASARGDHGDFSCSAGGHDEIDWWENANLSIIFPPGVVKHLEDKGITTLGQLNGFLDAWWNYRDIKGIDPAKQSQVENCLEAFLEEWEVRKQP